MAVDIATDGDSISIGVRAGTTNTPMWPAMITELGGGLTYAMYGVGGQGLEEVLSRTPGNLSASGASVYCIHAGTNDVSYGKFDIIESSILAIGQLCDAAHVDFRVGLIIPRSGILGVLPNLTTMQQHIKIANWQICKVCAEHNWKVMPYHDALLDISASEVGDGLLAAYDSGDLAHPTQAAYNIMGTIAAHASVPVSNSLTWGFGYPAGASRSWGFWRPNKVVGDADNGTETLAQGEGVTSGVVCISDGKTRTVVSLDATLISGSATVQYRTDYNNFSFNNSAIHWKSYSGQFRTADRFIQIKMAGA